MKDQKSLNDFKTAQEYIDYQREEREHNVTREQMIISAFENNICAKCYHKMIPHFRKWEPTKRDQKFFPSDEARYWYEATCKNNHYLEVTADQYGGIAE